MSPSHWYMWIHQIPAKPLYLRAKIRNRLTSLGAVALKDSVYLLPPRKELLRNLQHIAGEARSGGADAHILRVDFLDAHDEEAVIELFRQKRDEDYRAVGRAARAWAAEFATRSGPLPPEGALRARLARARKRLRTLERIDFFGSPARPEVQAALTALETQLRPDLPRPGVSTQGLIGRTWVTRRGIQVDRIASAWLIRRFIDSSARFRFIDPHEDEPRPRELTFDMIGGDFTHEEDRCTFETLVRRTGLKDPALARVAEIIHDIDIKDGKFGRAEARGVEQLLWGLLGSNPGDEERLHRGFALLDDLYQSFGRSSPTPGGREGTRGPNKGGLT